MSQRSALLLAILGTPFLSGPAWAGKKGGNGEGKHETKGGGKKHKGKGDGSRKGEQVEQEGDDVEEEVAPPEPTSNGMFLSPVRVSPGTAAPAGTGTTWEVGTPLYLSVTFPDNLAAMSVSSNGAADMHLQFYDAAEKYHNSPLADAKWEVPAPTAGETRALVVEVWPTDATKAEDPRRSAYIGEWLVGQGVGTHQYYVQLLARDPESGMCSQQPLPFGTFTFTGPADSAAFARSLATMKAAYLDSERMDRAAKTDLALSSGMMKAYTAAGWPEKPLKAVILDRDWEYFRDNWGQITSRRIHGQVAVDDGNGNCRVFFGTFDEVATGGGKYTVPELALITDDFPIARARVARAPAALALADPSLPRAADEARDIVDRFGGTVLVGAGAEASTLASSLAQRPSLVHFAVHAVADTARPESSELRLPAGAALRPADIMALPMEGTVVVLSACSSADGRVVSGEGVLGLSRAFLQAGASAVVGARWPVRDSEAADFVRAFYGALAEGRTVAGAIQASELEAAGDPRAAREAWVVIGDGGVVVFPGG
jgi:hypothetical protein